MKKIIMGVAAAALMSTTVNAAVTGDAASGWTVGKGDVQSAFGWNNETLQAEWSQGDISFRYDSSTDYEVVCTFAAGKSGNIQNKTRTVSTGLNTTLSVTGKLRNQIVGFNVGAAGTGGGGNDAPAVGDPCQAEGNNGKLSAVTEISSSGGGLYVVWEGQEVLLQAS